MDDEAELQARIAAIAGKINQHKQQQRQNRQAPQLGYSRWSPYGNAGRQIHKNRTLVVAEQQDGYVATSGANNQLMRKDVFDREQQNRQEMKEQQRAVKRRRRNAEEQSRIQQLHADGQTVELGGLKLRVAAGGSKLIRIRDGVTDSQDTPKRAEIEGIPFYRTKHGNLVRASALTARLPKQAPQCEHFTRHGSCPFGSRCRFAHDPDKVAICKDYLKSGSCPRGANCDLSHDMTYHRVSACTFFLRGNCTNSECRYPHINVSPAAPLCRAFATLGFCAKGADCDRRHVVECPDYANHGFCANRENGRCKLPHPDRAAVLRKAAEREAKIHASEDYSDLSSGGEEPEDMEDVDSDVEIITGEDTHELSQQHDFISFKKSI